jgi:hypothetical protein
MVWRKGELNLKVVKIQDCFNLYIIKFQIHSSLTIKANSIDNRYAANKFETALEILGILFILYVKYSQHTNLSLSCYMHNNHSLNTAGI